jgi:hypothetical protein
MPLCTRGVTVLFVPIVMLIPRTLSFNGLRRIAPSRAIVAGTSESTAAIVSATPQVPATVLLLSAIVMLRRSREAPGA